MKLHYITLVILIISGIVIGMTNYITDLSASSNADIDLSGLDGTEARLEDQQATAQELSDEVVNFKLESVVDFFNIPYVMIKIAWKAGKNFFASWAIVGTMITEIGDGLTESGIPIPSWIIPTLIAILITILLAIIIYAFFKWTWSD